MSTRKKTESQDTRPGARPDRPPFHRDLVYSRQAHRLAQEVRERLELLASMGSENVPAGVVHTATDMLTGARRMERATRKDRDRLELDYSRDVGLPLEPRAEA